MLQHDPTSTPNLGRHTAYLIFAALMLLGWLLLVQGGVPRAAEKSVHWDVSSYLRMARQEVEQMPMTARYDWTEERAQLAQGNPTDRYRKLARYGHIWIMAQCYRLAGPGLGGLQMSMAIYTVLLAGALLLLLLLLREAARALLPPDCGGFLPWTAPLAAMLFLASGGMVAYLNGHLVSEVPALLLLAAAAALIVRGLRAQTRPRAGVWGGLAGLALGAVYIVRLESVWTNAALLIALGAGYAMDRRVRPTVLALVAGAAVCGFAVLTAWIGYVGPVGSPHYFLQYATAYQAIVPIEFSRQNLLFALGPSALLMPLTLLARPWRGVAIAWLWFTLAAFPLAIVYMREGPIEARMFGVLLPPIALLLLLAAAGAGRLLQALTGTSRRGALAAALLLPVLFAGLGTLLQSAYGTTALGQWTGTGRWSIAAREDQAFHLTALTQVAAVLDAAHYPALHLLRAPDFYWSALASFASYLQRMPVDEPLGIPTPFKSRPDGPWFALVGAKNPVEELQRTVLSQYPELDKRQVQVQVPYQGPDLVLFQITPAPASP